MTKPRRPTSFDVARKAGVSRSVVSAVLNGTPGIGVGEETRKAVLEAIRELNYVVNAQARGMKTGESRCIAARGDTGNPLFLQVLEGIQEIGEQHGYHVLIYGNRSEDRSDIVNGYRQRRFDGLITLEAAGASDPAWAETVLTERMPFVSIEGYADDPRLESVHVDYACSVRDALDYMATRGALSPDYLQFMLPGSSEEPWGEKVRREAYEQWMSAAGLSPVVISITLDDDQGVERYLQSWQTSREAPVVLVNWSVALNRLLRQLDRLGYRPGRDCKLMALDDTLRVNRMLLPSIACMEIPYTKMGRMACERLLRQLGAAGGEEYGQEPVLLVQAERFAGESL